jgi:hypothetical protein
MQRQRPAAGQPQGLAAAEGRLAGKEVLKMNAAPAAVTEDEFIIMKCRRISKGLSSRAEDAHRGRRFRLITAVAAGKDKRQRAGQNDIRFAGQDLGTEQRIDRIPRRDTSGAD